MVEQLITFEIAKLAKERGFNIFSTAQYFDKDGNDYLGISSNAEDYNNKFLKPTQSLLQKWLRETIKCHIWTVMTGAEQFTLHFRYIDKTGYHHPHTYREDGEIKSFNSHEEALEEGLKQGLNLIKI